MTTILLQLLLQVIFILINAFFAATEIAVISLNPNKLRKLEEEGDKLAITHERDGMIEIAVKNVSHIQNR